jgi:hypothetical protein
MMRNQPFSENFKMGYKKKFINRESKIDLCYEDMYVRGRMYINGGLVFTASCWVTKPTQVKLLHPGLGWIHFS